MFTNAYGPTGSLVVGKPHTVVVAGDLWTLRYHHERRQLQVEESGWLVVADSVTRWTDVASLPNRLLAGLLERAWEDYQADVADRQSSEKYGF